MSSIARRLAALGASDPDARTWVNAVNAGGGSVSRTREVYVSALIVSLKAAGVWVSLDRLWLHAAENSVQALTDLKARAAATAVNSPTFTTDRGYAGNGTTSYLDLGLNANAATYFTRNDASFGGWISLSPTANGGFDFGWDYGGYSMILARYGALSYRFEINAGTNPSGAPANGGLDTGFFHGQRTAAAVSALFRNGVSVISSTAPSTALSARKFGAGAYVGGPANFSTSRYAASFIGASLAGKEAALYTAMRTYMTAVGVP
jgi:hypothetical protein